MADKRLERILEEVATGILPVPEALGQLRAFPYENVDDFARLDQHRALRCGFPEVVFGQGKTPAQMVKIVHRLAERNERVLVTRVSPELYEAVRVEIPQAVYHTLGRILIWDQAPGRPKIPGVLVVTAGTADLPVAEEAALTASAMDSQVERLSDVGVAGLHRLLDQLPILQKARVIVVVAGMEGALPSVVGGLVACPVIAVPTSVGYGASFQGLAALLGMLNSCANGVAVVNIDNGFGAGYLAAMINRMGPPAGEAK